MCSLWRPVTGSLQHCLWVYGSSRGLSDSDAAKKILKRIVQCFVKTFLIHNELHILSKSCCTLVILVSCESTGKVEKKWKSRVVKVKFRAHLFWILKSKLQTELAGQLCGQVWKTSSFWHVHVTVKQHWDILQVVDYLFEFLFRFSFLWKNCGYCPPWVLC